MATPFHTVTEYPTTEGPPGPYAEEVESVVVTFKSGKALTLHHPTVNLIRTKVRTEVSGFREAPTFNEVSREWTITVEFKCEEAELSVASPLVGFEPPNIDER